MGKKTPERFQRSMKNVAGKKHIYVTTEMKNNSLLKQQGDKVRLNKNPNTDSAYSSDESSLSEEDSWGDTDQRDLLQGYDENASMSLNDSKDHKASFLLKEDRTLSILFFQWEAERLFKLKKMRQLYTNIRKPKFQEPIVKCFQNSLGNIDSNKSIVPLLRICNNDSIYVNIKLIDETAEEEKLLNKYLNKKF